MAVLAIFPLVPRSLSNRAYRLSFMGTACSSLYSLYALYGVNLFPLTYHPFDLIYYGSSVESILYVIQRPRTWNLQAVQVYFQSIIATKDFIYFIYCLTFVTSHLCLKREHSSTPKYFKLFCCGILFIM